MATSEIISQADFFTGFFAALSTLGIRKPLRCGPRFDRAIETAYRTFVEKSEADGFETAFTIRRHPLHGTSSIVQEGLAAAIRLDLISLDNPSFQRINPKLDPMDAQSILSETPGGPELYEELVHGFLAAYEAQSDAERDALSAQRKEAESGWKCFHCGEVFINEACARAHFGRSEQNVSACVIKAGAEGSMLMALRDAESHAADAWAKLHEDSSEARMALVTTHARHQQNLQAAECLGYERGLKDYSTVEKERDRAHSHVATMERDMVKLRAEMESAHLANLKALAVAEKMREALKGAAEELSNHVLEPPYMTQNYSAIEARKVVRSAISSPPSLALLEFAEKVWKEALTSVFSQENRTKESLNELWLASDTYRDFTRATGEAK